MKRRTVMAAAILATAACCARTLMAATRDTSTAAAGWRSTLHRDHRLVGTIWSAAGSSDERALAEALRAARYRLLGEVHDNPDHHAIQLEQLRRLAAGGSRPLVAFEQFDREHDGALQQRLARGGATAEDVAEAVQLNRKGWNWDFYRPLVEIALRHGMALKAANLSTRTASRIVKEGTLQDPDLVASAVLGKVWSAEREEALRKVIFEGHCSAIPANLVERMAVAQRARDARLAEALLGAGSDGAVLVTGNGHARRDLGVPLYLDGRTCAVGILEVEAGKEEARDYFEAGVPGGPAFDFVCFTPAWARPDPCAGFKR